LAVSALAGLDLPWPSAPRFAWRPRQVETIDRTLARAFKPGVPWLADLALAADEDALPQAVAQLLHQGLSRDCVAFDWLARCAQELGRRWDQDACTFADVTIGVGRLMRALRQPGLCGDPGFGPAGGGGPQLLLLPAPGEQHVFGLALLAEQFSRHGWTVTGSTDAHGPDPLAWVAAHRVDVVGISVGSTGRAALVPELCAALRLASCHAGLSILVGGPLFDAHGGGPTAADLGADRVARDAREAVEIARQLCGLSDGQSLVPSHNGC
jgi:methylmalonyl-CoA mutase cobalamin-binding subunit